MTSKSSLLTNGPGEQEGVACGVLESMYWVLTRLFQAHLSVQFGSWPRSSVPGRRGAWWELFPTLTSPAFDGAHNRCSSATAREHRFQMGAGRALLLSKIKVTGLLDEVPVDLGRSHIEVWGVNSFIKRK